ncbi:hypothetical protein CRENBAI_003937 [Crenichthys baileyi]|uniref:Uncharacterized protein n=1 Tax=Crenichthys baileyi TaxID=28760 RepID=A0AAV9SFG5_9TELE
MASERGGVRQVFSITPITSRGGFKEEAASGITPATLLLPSPCFTFAKSCMFYLTGVPEPDLAVSFERLGLLSSEKKSFNHMNKNSNLRLLLWISPAGSFFYTWDPPQRTLSTLPPTQASTTVNSGHSNFLADLNSTSPFPRVKQSTGFILHLSLWRIISFSPFMLRFQFQVLALSLKIKLLTVKLSLLNCFLHVGQIC